MRAEDVESPTGRPVTRYADANGVKIAYQVTGSGPDLLVVPGLTSHVDLWWGEPMRRRFLRRLSSFSRLIRYDKRGTGLSDPVTTAPTLKQRMDEIRAVADAVKSKQPVILGWSEGAPIAIHYTVKNPGRVRGLVLYAAYARKPPVAVARLAASVLEQWGTGVSLDLFSPSIRDDPVARENVAALERASASPAMFQALGHSLMKTDVRPLIKQITVPTLLIHRRQELIPIDDARMMARTIPGARLIELEGVDHHPWVGDVDSILNPIHEFVVQHGASNSPKPAAASRPRRPIAGWASLTPAEERVVNLTSQGLSNGEIAEQLFISRLTVETHLKRVFTKLGVASRSELAGIAARK